jgi:hypothetical protein
LGRSPSERRIREALHQLVERGSVGTSGKGKKGDPYLFWRKFDSGAQDPYPPETNPEGPTGSNGEVRPNPIAFEEGVL